MSVRGFVIGRGVRRGFRRLLLAGALLAAAPGTAAAQEPGGFDLSELSIPPGFLDLTDLVLGTGSEGDIVATGVTVLGNVRAHILLAIDPSRGIRNGLTLGLKPEAWSLTDNIPALSNPVLDGVDFSRVALVLSSTDRVEDSRALRDEEWYFYREVYGTDEYRLKLRPGINLIAAIPSEELGADHPLTLVMNALGIEQGVILIQGGLGRSLGLLGGGGLPTGALRDLYLRAELPPMQPPGSPEWFRGGQLALELTGHPAVRLVGEVTLQIEGDELMFFLATSVARTGLSLAGGLVAEDGWDQPFGIPWLILRRVVLQLGITPAGSVQPGFAAGMVIGEKDIDVAVTVAISPAGVPTNFMFAGESESGVGFADLVELQGRMAAAREAGGAPPGAAQGTIPVEALPDMDVREIALKFAPRDALELGIERGFRVAGRLWLPLSADGELVDFAGVDVNVGDDGIWARGDLGAFELGPLVMNDARLDLTATREEQHLIVQGGVELFGASQALDLRLTRDEFSFRSETTMFDVFTADITASSVFNLRRPDFQVRAVAHADFGDAVGPMAQDGIMMFARASGDVVAAAAAATDAAQRALADAEATAEELRRVLETQRRRAEDAVTTSRRRQAETRRAMDAAQRALSSANSTHRATPNFPVARKAATLAAVRAATARHRVLAAAHSGSTAAVAANERLLAAIPPVDQSLPMMTAESAIRHVRGQLELMQLRLAEMQALLTAIEQAVARGEQLIAVDHAGFHGGLQPAMRGEALNWEIRGRFVGNPFEIRETMNFSRPGEGAAQMVRALIGT